MGAAPRTPSGCALAFFRVPGSPEAVHAYFTVQSKNDEDNAAAIRSGWSSSRCGTPGAANNCLPLWRATDAQKHNGIIAIALYGFAGALDGAIDGGADASADAAAG